MADLDDAYYDSFGYTDCECNGEINEDGDGECKAKYKGRFWCYVNQFADCTDKTRGDYRDWSYQPCIGRHEVVSREDDSDEDDEKEHIIDDLGQGYWDPLKLTLAQEVKWRQAPGVGESIAR